MKKVILSILLIILMTISFNLTTYSEPYIRPMDQDLLDMRNDIKSLNLINNLHLNNQQMRDYLAILKNLKTKQDIFETTLKNDFIKQKVVFNQHIKQLRENKKISQSIEIEVKKLDDKMKEDIINFNKERQLLEKNLDKLLTDNQIMLVYENIPCLIPPGDLKNPTRIGQAENNDEVKDGLKEIRKMNVLIYFIAREIWVSKYIEFYENHLKVMNNKERNIEKNRLFKIFDETRNLNEVDFEIQKDELAKRVTAKIFGEIKNFRKCDPHVLGEDLLNINMIPVIEKRLKEAT
ncbi:MAG: hypothetical protein AB1782_17085 [Cyanobacteriota bacterium]